MTRSRDILKGKIKRLLREQADMGQLCDPAVEHCVAALEAFVHDLGRRMTKEAEDSGVDVITPIELKRCVLASADLKFLHEKVASIDESDAKYHKPARKRKTPASAEAEGSTKKKAKSKGSKKAKAAAAKPARGQAEHEEGPTAAPPTAAVATAIVAAIEEDDNYDSSDSE